MGATTDHALGRNLRFFSVIESAPGGAYGTDGQEALAGGDAAKVLSSSIEFTVARNPRMDARASGRFWSGSRGSKKLAGAVKATFFQRAAQRQTSIL